MATLLLTAVGTVFGGPLGGALGALIGQQVDSAIIGSRTVEGPRLKELTVQTSSYGSTLPRHYGRMRAAGTVIWSTELIEHREKQGGGKGKPSVTAYSYTASFAVALASRPIADIKRIWADGNLLRGAGGDLKAGGAMRLYTGHGDQPVDPLLAQAEGIAMCPAFRHSAYVVFEDLQRADFGNRLPSLTFEILADDADIPIALIAGDIVPDAVATGLDEQLSGFTIDRGTAGDVLATISAAIPLACSVRGDSLDIRLAESRLAAPPASLPLPAAASGSDRAGQQAHHATGISRRREPLPRARQIALRYYDPDRDYQPGLQRGRGRAEPGDLAVIDLPATLGAAQAMRLADRACRRTTRATETMQYRVTELDAGVAPGDIVRLPAEPGDWRVEQWEWQADGVTLDLVALAAAAPGSPAATDPGRINLPLDLTAAPTVIAAFELPWDGIGERDRPALFVAASAASAGWSGAALFAEQPGGTLVPLGATGRRRAVLGTTTTLLGSGSPLLVDRRNSVVVQLAGADLALVDATMAQLLQGANRALIDNEIVQFGSAQALGAGAWRLSQLLRGRAGSEWAIDGHRIGEPFVLLDDALVPLDPALLGDAALAGVVASGLGDTLPVTSPVHGACTTVQPLAPVHGTIATGATGDLTATWVRRSRGAWAWADLVDVPLNEQSEAWDIALGDPDQPTLRWRTTEAMIDIPASQIVALPSGTPRILSIRQIGSRALSHALSLPF
ncbi:phage tail protein [Novosphingobium lentum]|uniref:phage tail protein n=1 Tax=Novosphingobium lentum TaxID=145287 RepID=UPI00082DA874|nr:phage tail protein [Novosphingobium lentum]